jgi:hypothetical protein
VADCAGGHLAVLPRIGDEKGNRLREIWRAGSLPENSIARDRLFRLELPKSTAHRWNTASDIT